MLPSSSMRILGKDFSLNSAAVFIAGPLLGIPVFGALLLLAGPSDAAGQTFWQGSGKGNGMRWNSFGNWTGNVPDSSTVAGFNAGGSSNIQVNTTAAALGLLFQNTSISRTLSLSGGGNSLTIGASGIDNQSANLQTFDGVPINLAAAQSWSGGSLTLSGAIALATHTLTLAPGSGATFNMDSVISGSGGMTVNGAGTVLLNATATYTGATTVQNGTLRINAANRLLTTTALTVNGGTFDLNGNNQTVGSLSGSGGTIALGSGVLTTNTSGSSSYSGSITGSGGITHSGSGTLSLSGSSSYSGSTIVSAGTLNVAHANALGTTGGGTTVSSGATLSLQGSVTVTGESLTLTGAGAGGAGALRNVSGTNTWDGPVTLGGNTTITAAGGILHVGYHPALVSSVESDTLNIGTNTLTVNTDGGHVNIASIISGTSGGLIKQGSGILTLSGLHNSYTGTTSIEDGYLLLNTLSFNFPPNFVYVNQGLQGNVIIGDEVGAAGSASLVLANYGGDKISDSVNIRVNSDGMLNLNGTSDIIGSLTLKGGDVATGVGTLGVAGNINVLASTREANISGFLSLNSGVRTFDVENGATLRVDATMNDGGIIKSGTGTMILTSNDTSTYAGTTTVDGGVLNVRANNALGQGLNSAAGAGTEVNAGAALELQGGITIANERLTLGSTGIGDAGGLRNVSGSNTFSGSINLDGNSRINADSGSMLTLNGNTLAMSTYDLSVGGSGDTTITRDISSSVSAGTLTKDGTGTLSLSGNSTYRGETLINEGVVALGSDFGLGSAAGSTTVANGAALNLQGNISTGEAITFQGTGISNAGAIRNVSGTNTISGALTLSGAGRINSDAGTLTLSGGIGGSGNALTVGGSGNTTISGVIATGGGTLTKEGSGMLTLSGANTFTGLTTVSAGTLAMGATNVFGSSNFVTTATGSVMDMNGFDQTLGGVTGTGTLAFGGGELTLTGASTFAGIFDGAGTVIINAGASLTLGADFNNSELNIVLNGGTLFVGNQSSTFGSLTVESSSIIDFGDSSSIIEFTNGVTANALLQVQNWVEMVDYFYSTLNAGVQGVSPLNNIVFTGFTGDNTKWLSYTDGPYNNHQITPVPEPSVYGAGLMTSILGLLAWRRRRQRAAA